jgi:hypothetical protein
MVGIWAAAFAQQLSDRLEDKKAENAIRQVANDEYDAELVNIYTDQFKSNREFYLNRMAVDQAERSKLQGDTIIATNAVREVLDKTTIPQILGNEVKPLSNQEKQARVDDNEVYKFVKTLKLRNPNLRLTKDMLVPAIVKAMKVSPNLFMKSSAKSEINKAPDTTIDPEAQKNMNKMFKAEAELKSISDDESFFSMASDFLSPVWASLTNEPGRRMTQEEAKSLMIKRYGDNYSKVNKYKEEYVSGRGTQLRINPEVASGLYEEVLERGRVIEEERAAGLAEDRRQKGIVSKIAHDQTRKANLSPMYMTNLSNESRKDVIVKLTTIYGTDDRDPQGNLMFSKKRSGELKQLDQIGQLLADKAAREAREDANILRNERNGEIWKYNANNPQAGIDLREEALANTKASGIVAEFQKEMERRGPGIAVPAKEQIEILERLWKGAYGSTLKASGSPSSKKGGGTSTIIDLNPKKNSNAGNIVQDQNIASGKTHKITPKTINYFPGFTVGDTVQVEFKKPNNTYTEGSYEVTKVP